MCNPKSRKFSLVKRGTLGFGIKNTALRIGNPTCDWNPESTGWNSESKTVLDPLTFGERVDLPKILPSLCSHRFLSSSSPQALVLTREGKTWCAGEFFFPVFARRTIDS